MKLTFLKIILLSVLVAIAQANSIGEISTGRNNEIVDIDGRSGRKLLTPSKIIILKGILLPTVSFLLSIVTKAAHRSLHLLFGIVFGLGLAIALCTFTPFCRITLAGPGQMAMDQITDLMKTYVTPENINMASEYVDTAIEQYQVLKSELS